MMAPRKWIDDGATSKGKTTATTKGKASLPTSNQSHTEDTGSISLQELFADVQPSQQQEVQFLQMLYEMRSKWRSNSCNLIVSGNKWRSTVRTSLTTRGDETTQPTAPDLSCSPPKQLYANKGMVAVLIRLRVSEIFLELWSGSLCPLRESLSWRLRYRFLSLYISFFFFSSHNSFVSFAYYLT